MSRVMPAGTKVVCPECKRVMVIAKRDIQTGDSLNSETFQNVDFAGASGSKAECPFDGTPFGRVKGGISSGTELYVQGYEGWT